MKELDSWLKTAEGLLQAVDKTAKAVSTASKQQDLPKSSSSADLDDDYDALYIPVASQVAPEQPRALETTPPSAGSTRPPRSRPPQQAVRPDAAARKPSTSSRNSSTSSLPETAAGPSAVKPSAIRGAPAPITSEGQMTTPQSQPAPVNGTPALAKQPPEVAKKPEPAKREAHGAAISAVKIPETESMPPQALPTVSPNDVSLVQPPPAGKAAVAAPALPTTVTTHVPQPPPTASESSQGATLQQEAAPIAPAPQPAAPPATTEGPDDKVKRLSRLVEGLKRKVDRLQSENVQLEEMLAAADAAHRGGSGEISRLEDALAREQAARTSREAALTGALAAKEGDLMTLRDELEAVTSRAAAFADALATREAERATADEERSISESQLIGALRKEVEAAESLLDEERKAHAATRRAFAAREHELDTSMAEVAGSLAAMQRNVDEKTTRAAVAEECRSALEAEVESLTQRVQLAEAKIQEASESQGQGQAMHTSESSFALQRVEELEAALSEARRGQGAAESTAATATEDCVRMRTELDTLHRQLADARNSDSAGLKRRLQEVTDALYQKQAQLERATADKAAAQLHLERQLSVAQADQVRRRTAAVDRVFSGSEEGYGVVPMDSLGESYARFANAPGHLGGAVKAGARLLDSSAAQAVRVLRQYPLGRLIVFCYIILMHLFIYMLLHRLQHRAFAAMAAAEGNSLEELHHG